MIVLMMMGKVGTSKCESQSRSPGQFSDNGVPCKEYVWRTRLILPAFDKPTTFRGIHFCSPPRSWSFLFLKKLSVLDLSVFKIQMQSSTSCTLCWQDIRICPLRKRQREYPRRMLLRLCSDDVYSPLPCSYLELADWVLEDAMQAAKEDREWEKTEQDDLKAGEIRIRL